MDTIHLSVRIDRRLKKKLKRVTEITGQKSSDVVRKAIERECDDVLSMQTTAERLKDVIGALSSERPGSSGRVREVMTEVLEEKRTRWHK